VGAEPKPVNACASLLGTAVPPVRGESWRTVTATHKTVPFRTPN